MVNRRQWLIAQRKEKLNHNNNNAKEKSQKLQEKNRNRNFLPSLWTSPGDNKKMLFILKTSCQGQSFEETGFFLQGWSQLTTLMPTLKSIAVTIYPNE